MDRLSEVTVSIDSVVFPLNNALITGQSNLDKNARCYIRYKFYDKSEYSKWSEPKIKKKL